MNDLERADRAKELLENPVFKEAYAGVRADLITALETCGFMDVETQHELTVSLQLLKRLKTKLERFVDDGKVESHKLKQQTWRDRMVQSVRTMSY